MSYMEDHKYLVAESNSIFQNIIATQTLHITPKKLFSSQKGPPTCATRVGGMMWQQLNHFDCITSND